MKVLVTLAGCCGILVCVGFVFLGLMAEDPLFTAIALAFMFVCFVLVEMGRDVVDNMQRRRHQ